MRKNDGRREHSNGKINPDGNPISVISRISKTLTEDGVSVLEYRIEVPAFPDSGRGFQRIEGFYGVASASCVRFCEESLFPALSREYRESGDARKRFTFRRTIYRHTVRMSENHGILSVEREVLLTRAGRVCFRRRLLEDWRCTDGRLIPEKNGSPVPKLKN